MSLPIVAFTFLFLLALLCGLEAAWFKVSPSKLQALPQSKKLLATREVLHHQPIVLNHILFLIMIATYFGSIMIHKFEDNHNVWHVWLFRLFPFLMFYFGEIIPKLIGIKYAARICVWTTCFMRVILVALYPLTWLNEITWSSMGGKAEILREKDVRETIGAAVGDKALEKLEGKVMDTFIEAGNMQVRDLMLPVSECTILPLLTNGYEVRQTGKKKSKFFLVQDINDPDNLFGYVSASVLLSALPMNGDELNLRKYRLTLTMVGAHEFCQEILDDLLTQEVVGVQERGKLVGILTQAYFFAFVAQKAAKNN